MPSDTCPMNGSMELRVRTDESGLDQGRDFVSSALSELQAGSEAVFALTTSFLELFENLIRHGSETNSDGSAVLSVAVREDSALLTVTDRSAEFDMLAYQDPGQLYMIKKGITGKMGIKTIKALCDTVSYVREEGTNKYILKKKRGR